MERYDYAQGESRLQHEQPTMDPDTGRSASTGTRADPAEEQRLRITQQSDSVSRDNDASLQTIIFKDHLGQPYIWPIELCRSRESATSLIEEIYKSKFDDYYERWVQKGYYELVTHDGAIILPTVWKFIVKPSAIIKISLGTHGTLRPVPNAVIETSRHPERTSDFLRDDARDYSETEWKPDVYVEDVTIDVGDPSAPLDPLDDDNESEEDSDSMLSTSDNEGELVEDVEPPVPPREVPPLLDADGNQFSFAVDTSKVAPQLQNQQKIEDKADVLRLSREAQDIGGGPVEQYRITKAILGGSDTRAVIKIHVLPGPMNTNLGNSTKTTWYHVQAEQLSFTHIKEICIGLPNLSQRLQLLTREVLAKVEKHKVKAFVDGFFIEPGTVLRAVEKCQPDPQAVTFSCIPYLELQKLPRRPPPKQSERLFPPRTLMQAMYPYESVRDRDSEQAYRKLGNSQGNSLVYVPNLWMINIGTGIVVTCGHRPLADEMIKSIEVVKEDLGRLGITDMAKSPLTCIRLVDRESLVHLYPLETCRSYFQMEAKMKALNTVSAEIQNQDSLALIWTTAEGKQLVTPNKWGSIATKTDRIFIELEVVEQDARTSELLDLKVDELLGFVGSVPPFFHWPSAATKAPISEKIESRDVVISGALHESKCLEYAEKSMLNDTLDSYSTVNAVDKTFTSTTYYKSLPEDTQGHIDAQLRSLNSSKRSVVDGSLHASVIKGQCSSISAKADAFCKIVQATLRLFVRETDKNSILRKVWGAMGNVHNFAANVQKRGAVAPETTQDFQDFRARRRDAGNTGWVLRRDEDGSILLPGADKKLKRAVRRCRQCMGTPFSDAETAIGHLNMHLNQFNSSETNHSSTDETSATSGSTNKPNLNDWIAQEKHIELEKSNAGGLKILTQVCEDAAKVFRQLKELADGVRNEDGKKSDLYTFPRQLLEAFRKLIVFYLALERALYHTEDAYQRLRSGIRIDEDDLPYSEQGLSVLSRFARGVENSVLLARHELCIMVKPETSLDPMQGLSLGSEYICAWLMRRLLVKPLENRMSIGDMYREYLSTIQFEVNHRPGKRLIRAINLLQEELQVLATINMWQTNLVQNYMRVLDDKSYAIDVPSRRAMFPFERLLLQSCRENLAIAREEYDDLLRRCGPLSDQTKQSLEIYEEDHGKAITAFTVVTVIFLPLSFVTSYFGMNTVDIRDMNSEQGLFWAIALPLTFVTIGATVLIGYNGDVFRDFISSLWHVITGKQDSSMSARGISVAQRKRAKQMQDNADTSLDMSLADEAEYMKPLPEPSYGEEWYTKSHVPYTTYTEAIEPISSRMARHARPEYAPPPPPRVGFRTQHLTSTVPEYTEPMSYGGRRHYEARRPARYEEDVDEWEYKPQPRREVVTYNEVIKLDGRDGRDGLQDEYDWHKRRRRRHVEGNRRVRR